jgi:predicted nuclease of restriction endonuclease-like RecB superfamily
MPSGEHWNRGWAATGTRVLIFTADSETAYAIAREHLVMPMTCDISRPERYDVLERFRHGNLRTLVSARVLNEGLDVPDADVAVVVGGASESENTCSEWVDCCGRARASVPWCMSLLRGTPSKSVRRAGDAKVLLSVDLLSYSVAWTLVVPHYLGEHDHPWLRALLDEHERFIGRPRRELEARLRDPLEPAAEAQTCHPGSRETPAPERKSAVPPRRARAHVFGEAARTSAPPQTVWTTVAAALGVSREDLQVSLFGDLPGERLVAASVQPLSAMELALRCNLAVVQGMLFRATVVRIEIEGNTRVPVRHAKWRGLICTLAGRSDSPSATVELSGPFALFRNTRLYGRALGELVPLLAWCPRFRLRADCVFHGRRLTLQLGSGDPIFPSCAPRRYDSLLEERFAREFRRLAPTCS